MNRLLLYVLFFLFINVLYSQGEFYGNIFDDKENNLNFKATELKNLKYESVQISGVIQSSCPMKGCWMEIKTNDETVFVKFKDYSFFVPVRGIKGKKATIRGDIFFDTLSVTEQKHYAYDAGKSSEEINNINKPKVIATAIAEGVLIED
mgnify:FL=1